MKRIMIMLIFAVTAIKVYSQNFERVTDIDLTSGYLGFASWCDYNSDGFLDVIISGIDFGDDPDHAILYKNNGDKTFSETNIDIIPRVVYGGLSWGDFDNNGTLDLIYAGTISGRSEDNITKVYKNIGDSSFVEIPHTVPNLAQCYVEWVDVNNDGLLDIYYQGINSENNFDLGIYKNNGNEEFKKININIDKIWGPRGNYTENSAKWADFDNDGLKDVIIAMSSSDNYNFEFYKNLGDFKFQKIDIGLPDLNYVNLAVGDLNQDGFYDIVFTGSSQLSLYSGDINAPIYVFFNNGDLTFTKDYKINNVGVFWNTLELGDINNDGYLDIIDYGTGGSTRITNIYLNNKDETFNYLPHNLLNSSEGGASFGDYDNDNDLDILYYGRVYSPSEMEVTYVYENKSIVGNSIPEAPDNIGLFATNNDLLISWTKGGDDLADSSRLNYNLRIGSGFNQNTLLSCNSLSGKLKTVDWGNMNLNRNFLFKNFPEGRFNIELQSIDNSYNASLFSNPLNFCFKSTSHLLGDSLFICEGDSIKIGIHGNYNSFLWNTGSKDSIVYVKKEGLYNVNLTHSDGCISSETVFLRVHGRPQISLGDNITACQGDTISLEIPDFDEILWNNGTDNNYINISASGSYWVTVKDSTNCPNSDTITALFNPLPNADLGEDHSITIQDTLTLTTESSFDSYLWSNGSINDTLVVYGKNIGLGGHIYWLEVTNDFGCSNSDTINISNSPNFNWAIGNSSLSQDEIWSSAITDENEVYICGRLNIDQNYGDYAILARIDSSGKLIWQYQPELFFGEARDMSIDSKGNIIIVGNYYQGSMSIDSIEFTPTNNPRIFMAKFDRNGKVLWAKDFGSNDHSRTSYVNAVEIDENDNIYITGNFNDTLEFGHLALERVRSKKLWEYDIYLAAFDSNGEIQWAKSVGGIGDDCAYDICIRNDKLYMAGAFSTRDAIFDTIVSNRNNANELDYVAAFSLSGKIIWLKSSTPVGYSLGEMVDLALDSKGNIYAYGHIYGKLAFDQDTIDNPFQQNGLNVRGGMLVKYDSTGNTVWVKSLNNAFAHDYSQWVLGAIGRVSGEIVCDKEDNLFLASSFVDSVQLDFYTLHSKDSYLSGKARDAYLIKYNEIGYPQWFRQIGGDDDVFVTTLANNRNGQVIFGGHHKSLILNFDGTSLVNNTGRDEVFYIAQLLDTSENICPKINARFITSRNYICQGDSLPVYGAGNYTNTLNLYRNGDISTKSYQSKFFLKYPGDYQIIINQDLVCSDTTKSTYIGLRNKPISLIHYYPDSIICAEETVQLEVQADINCQYKWYLDDILQQTLTSNKIEANSPGNYSSLVSDGYCQSSDTVVIISGMPLVGFEPVADLILCPDEQISLNTATNSNYVYTWYFNGNLTDNNTNMLTVTQPGKYKVQVNNAYCSDADSVVISSEVFPFINILPDTLIAGYLPLEISPSGDSLFIYHWYLNNNYWPFSANFNITAQEFGNYKIVASNICGYALDNVLVLDALTVDNLGQTTSHEITLYPNPTHGMFRVYTGDMKLYSIIIYNSAGIRIRQQEITTSKNTFDFDLSNEKEGLYYLQINSADGMLVRKIVVN